MMFIKRTKLRLKPGGCSLFFTENPDLYQDLKEGKEVEIPDIAKEEILKHFSGVIEVVKKRKKMKVKEERKEVDND